MSTRSGPRSVASPASFADSPTPGPVPSPRAAAATTLDRRKSRRLLLAMIALPLPLQQPPRSGFVQADCDSFRVPKLLNKEFDATLATEREEPERQKPRVSGFVASVCFRGPMLYPVELQMLSADGSAGY